MPPRKVQWAVLISSGDTVEVLEIDTSKRRHKATISHKGDVSTVYLDQLMMV